MSEHLCAKQAPGPRYETASCIRGGVTGLFSCFDHCVAAFMISLGKLLDVSLF